MAVWYSCDVMDTDTRLQPAFVPPPSTYVYPPAFNLRLTQLLQLSKCSLRSNIGPESEAMYAKKMALHHENWTTQQEESRQERPVNSPSSRL